MKLKSSLLVVCSLVFPIVAAALDDIDSNTTWDEIRADGRSLVFGRLEGRFDGPEYRGRKLRVRHEASGKEHLIPVEKGLGYFEAALPHGMYALVAIEAVYFPPIKPMNPRRFPPVRQKYAIRADDGAAPPSFPVLTDKPVYLGTIRSSVGVSGLVYEGHELQVVDEYQETLEHLELRHGVLVASLERSQVQATRYFLLEPVVKESPLALPLEADALKQARAYIEEAKYEQAVSWLQTFMPASDAERTEARLLVGEAHLADDRFDQAIEELGEVLLQEPENTRALRLLARAHALKGNREDARSLYQGLSEALPHDAEANLHLGFHYAIQGQSELAAEAFRASFQENFDYLLHDLMPYALALKQEGVRYEPPRVIDGAIKAPSTIHSRRGARGAFALLIDHEGRVIAAHLTPNAGSWAPAQMMSIIRAQFKPARINDVEIPCLVIMGEGRVIEPAR